MPYHLRIVTSVGEDRQLESPFASVEAAMIVARTAISHGAKRACVDDEDGRTVADCHADREAPDESGSVS